MMSHSKSRVSGVSYNSKWAMVPKGMTAGMVVKIKQKNTCRHFRIMVISIVKFCETCPRSGKRYFSSSSS